MFFEEARQRTTHEQEYSEIEINCGFGVYHRLRCRYPKRTISDIVRLFDHPPLPRVEFKPAEPIIKDVFKYQRIYYNDKGRRLSFVVVITSYLQKLNRKFGFEPYDFKRNLAEARRFIDKAGGNRQAHYYLTCFAKEVIPPNSFGFNYVLGCVKDHWKLDKKEVKCKKRSIDNFT